MEGLIKKYELRNKMAELVFKNNKATMLDMQKAYSSQKFYKEFILDLKSIMPNYIKKQ